jgi:hypothetical protein
LGKEELVQVREKQIEDKDLEIKEIGEQLAGKDQNKLSQK